MKISNQIRIGLMVVAAVVLPGRIAAQQSQLISPPQAVVDPAPAEPTQMASLLSAPELPSPARESARAETAGFAFTPVVGVSAPSAEAGTHKFWDRENKILFAAAGGLAAADFCVTRRNLASGGRELNPVTRVLSGSTPGLAANFAIETSGLIAVNYVLHKTGHHKLERLTSFVNIGASTSAVAFGLTHP